jgi:hypothetical protein
MPNDADVVMKLKRLSEKAAFFMVLKNAFTSFCQQLVNKIDNKNNDSQTILFL